MAPSSVAWWPRSTSCSPSVSTPWSIRWKLASPRVDRVGLAARVADTVADVARATFTENAVSAAAAPRATECCPVCCAAQPLPVIA